MIMRALPISILMLAAVGVFIVWRSDNGRGGTPIEQGAAVQRAERAATLEIDDLQEPARGVVTRAPVEVAPEADAETMAAEADADVISVTVQLEAEPGTELHEGLSVEIVVIGPDDAVEVLGAADTDAAGICHLELPWVDGDRRLHAGLAEPGWISMRTRVWSRDGRTYSGTLQAVRGVTIRGRLVDEAGEGVPGSVQLSKRFLMPNGPRLGGGRTCRARPDGHFELHAHASLFEPEEPGNAPLLFGYSPGHGTGCLVDFRAPADGTQVELRVTGAGRLVGRVTDGADHPVQALKVIARAASLGEARTTLVSLESYKEGGGYLVADTVTDERGRFRIDGLRAEAYWLFAEDSSSSVFQRTYLDLHRDPIPADGTDLELVLKRPSLILSVLASDGSPWAGGIDHESGLTVRPRPGITWPDQPIITVENQATGDHLYGRALDDGRIVYAIGDAAELRCTVFGGPLGGEGFPLQVHTLRVAEASDSGGQVQLVVHAESLAGWGTLDVVGSVVRRESGIPRAMTIGPTNEPSSAGSVFGAPIPPARVLPSGPLEWLVGHEFFVEDIASDGTVVAQTNAFTPVGSDMRLPEGRYRVVIRPYPSLDGMLLADAGGAEAVVEIRAGQKSTVRLAIDAGSTLRIYVDAEPGEIATLWLVSPTGRRHDLIRTRLGRGTWTWPARMPLESQIVPSGQHALHAKVGDREIVIPVDLKPAECLDVLVR